MPTHREHATAGAYVCCGTPGSRASRGFTLLELLIAVALLAVLAVLSWRGLESVLDTRDRLAREGDQLRALTVAFAQLDEDLRRSWSVRALLPSEAPIVFVPEADGLAMVLVREGGGALEPVRLERIAYRLRAGLLERGFGRYLPGAPAASTLFEWQPLLDGVRRVDFRAFVEQQGWLAGEALQSIGTGERPAPGSAFGIGGASQPPVTGVELAIERGDRERYLRIFSVRD